MHINEEVLYATKSRSDGDADADADPFSNDRTGHDEGDINRIPASDDLVNRFSDALTGLSHGRLLSSTTGEMGFSLCLSNRRILLSCIHYTQYGVDVAQE